MDWLEEKVEQLRKILQEKSLVLALVWYLCIGMAGAFTLYWITQNLCLAWLDVLERRNSILLNGQQFQSMEEWKKVVRESGYSFKYGQALSKILWIFYHSCQYLYMIICFAIVGKIFLETKIKPAVLAVAQGLNYINMGDYSHEMAWRSQDEMGALCQEVEQIRRMLLKNKKDQWRQQEEQRKINAAFAHDIRTPLTVIRGYTEFLQKYVPKGKVTEEMLLEKLNTMHEQEERLLHFSTTMTTIQNIEKWEVSGNWYGVSELSEEVEGVLEGIRLNTDKEINFQMDVPQQEVFLDKNLLMEVFENLLSNGLRYARASIQIEGRLVGREFTLFVKDDGPGFSEKALRNGMETYFSEEENSREHFGIGLSICRMLCENHGGSLSLQNSVTEGAIVAATLVVGIRNHF
ncbi:hypothetical protein C806_03382 [Lachnospiraceae bacterium 3-1]|nr:hypothetical protein C806_03382 [Lachnospiraceae bacterium 3-1]